MHPMMTPYLAEVRRADAERLASSRRRRRDARAGDDQVREPHRRPILLARRLRPASELAERLAAVFGRVPRHQRFGDGLLEPCADGAEPLGRLG
jgi:hypothetical protein